MECRLRELRIKRGLNQTGMAMILNVSQQTISRIESGESQIPVDLALRAAEYFHVSMDYMLGLSDEINNTIGMRKDLHMLNGHEDFLLEFTRLSDMQKRAVKYLVHGLADAQRKYEEDSDFT